MYNQYRKLDPSRILQLKRQGLSNAQIAQRFGVTSGAVYSVLRKANDGNLFIVLNSSAPKRILDA